MTISFILRLPIVISCFKKSIFIPIFVVVGLLIKNGMSLSTTLTSSRSSCSPIKTGIFTCFKLLISTPSTILNKELLFISLLLNFAVLHLDIQQTDLAKMFPQWFWIMHYLKFLLSNHFFLMTICLPCQQCYMHC